MIQTKVFASPTHHYLKATFLIHSFLPMMLGGRGSSHCSIWEFFLYYSNSVFVQKFGNTAIHFKSCTFKDKKSMVFFIFLKKYLHISEMQN